MIVRGSVLNVACYLGYFHLFWRAKSMSNSMYKIFYWKARKTVIPYQVLTRTRHIVFSMEDTKVCHGISDSLLQVPTCSSVTAYHTGSPTSTWGYRSTLVSSRRIIWENSSVCLPAFISWSLLACIIVSSRVRFFTFHHHLLSLALAGYTFVIPIYAHFVIWLSQDLLEFCFHIPSSSFSFISMVCLFHFGPEVKDWPPEATWYNDRHFPLSSRPSLFFWRQTSSLLSQIFLTFPVSGLTTTSLYEGGCYMKNSFV